VAAVSTSRATPRPFGSRLAPRGGKEVDALALRAQPGGFWLRLSGDTLRAMRLGLLVALTALLIVPARAATKPSPYKRTAVCSASSVSVTFDGRSIVVVSRGRTVGRSRTVGRATRLTRSVNSVCVRTTHRGLVRWALTRDFHGSGALTCGEDAAKFQQVVIETEPVRNYSGRIIGSRLAVWRGRYWSGGEMVEATVGITKPWLSYNPDVCHVGSSSARSSS